MSNLPPEISNGTLIAAVVQSDSIVRAISHELNRVYPGLAVDANTVRQLLQATVLRPEIAKGEQAVQATQQLLAAHAKISQDRAHRRTPKLSPAMLPRKQATDLEALHIDKLDAMHGG